MQQSDRTYRFIDDPTHKENLSGRVTAACLNCRRKKIKCSGETDCQQCVEKGLTCDGPPSRKRPKKDNVSTSSREILSIDEQVQQSRDGAGKRDRLQHQQQQPAKLPNDDSGYSSTGKDFQHRVSHEGGSFMAGVSRHSSSTRSPTFLQPLTTSGEQTQPTVSSAPPSFTSPFAFNTTMPQHSSPTDVSPTTTTAEDWSFVRPENTSAQPYYRRATQSSDASHSTHTAPAAASVSAGSMDWSRRNSEDWWSSSNAQSSTDLLAQAEVLEQQAQSLRRLASRRLSEGSGVAGSQSITLPQPSPGMSGVPVPSNFYDPTFRPHDTFDTSAFFRADGTLRSGLTPGAAEYRSFWDVNSMQYSQLATGPYPTSVAEGHMSMSSTSTSHAQDFGAPQGPPGRPSDAAEYSRDTRRYPGSSGS